jgi:hypothetical protein
MAIIFQSLWSLQTFLDAGALEDRSVPSKRVTAAMIEPSTASEVQIEESNLRGKRDQIIIATVILAGMTTAIVISVAGVRLSETGVEIETTSEVTLGDLIAMNVVHTIDLPIVAGRQHFLNHLRRAFCLYRKTYLVNLLKLPLGKREPHHQAEAVVR